MEKLVIPSEMSEAEAIVAVPRFRQVRIEDLPPGVQANDPKGVIQSVRSQFLFSDKDDLLLQNRVLDSTGIEHVKYQQSYGGIPVWGSDLIIHNRGGKFAFAVGNVVTGMRMASSFNPEPTVEGDAAVRIASEDYARANVGQSSISDVARRLVILPREREEVFLAWHVTFFVEREGKTPSLWNYFIEPDLGRILMKYDSVMTEQASGPSGNAMYPRIPGWVNELDVEPNGSLYIMDTEKLRTVTMSGGTTGSGVVVTAPLSGFTDAIVNDGHGYAEVVLNMLSGWFSFNSIDGQGKKIVSRVHYGSSYENAFWFNGQMTYGDGGTTLNPLSGSPDVVAHEIAHGFTEYHSNLIYSNQSGGMNESFSDIAGIAVKYYFQPESANFLIGDKLFKPPSTRLALRFMCDPQRDGLSVGHYSLYSYGMDPHYSSGIMNRAFCLMASRFSSGLPTGEATAAGVSRAAKIFFEANAYYWSTSSTFAQGAEGTMDAAAALGYTDTERSYIALSWADVGVTLSNAPLRIAARNAELVMGGGESTTVPVAITRNLGFSDPVTFTSFGWPAGASGTFAPNPALATDTSSALTITIPAGMPGGNHLISIRGQGNTQIANTQLTLQIVPLLTNGQTVSGLANSMSNWYYFRVVVPRHVATLRARLGGASTGDADLYVRRGALPAWSAYDCRAFFAHNGETCRVSSPEPGTFFIGVHAYSSYSDVSLTVDWTFSPVQLTQLIHPLPSALGGQATTATVRLNRAAESGGEVISLSVDRPTVASVPASVTVPEGQQQATFPITLFTVRWPTDVLVAANNSAGRVEGRLTVQPLPRVLSSFTVERESLTSGEMVRGTLKLDASALPGGATIELRSSDNNVRIPTSVTIGEGANEAPVEILTRRVAAETSVTITATYASVSRDVRLFLGPSTSGLIGSFAEPDGSTGESGPTTLTGDGERSVSFLAPGACAAVHSDKHLDGFLSWLATYSVLFIVALQILIARLSGPKAQLLLGKRPSSDDRACNRGR